MMILMTKTMMTTVMMDTITTINNYDSDNDDSLTGYITWYHRSLSVNQNRSLWSTQSVACSRELKQRKVMGKVVDA